MDWERFSVIDGYNYNKYSRAKWDSAEFQRILNYKRRMLRRPTRGEKRFRDCFESININLKLERQRIFLETKTKHDKKAFIADFFLPRLKLVFEIDGDTHDSERAKIYDLSRASFLATKGIQVVRITNDQTKDKETCKNLILKAIRERREHRFASPKRFNPVPKPKDRSEDKQNAIQEFIAKGCNYKVLPTVFSKRSTTNRQPRRKPDRAKPALKKQPATIIRKNRN